MADSTRTTLDKIAMMIPILRTRGEPPRDPRLKRSRPLLGILVLAVVAAIAIPAINTMVIIPAYTELLVNTMEIGAARLATHTVPPPLKNQGLTHHSLDSPRFLADIYRLESTLGLLKVKVYSKEGVVLYSSTPSELNTVAREQHFLQIVARGKTYSKLTTETKIMPSGESEIIDVVETYIPLMNGNSFLGAFELYFDISAVKQRMDRFNTYATYGGIITSICLLLVVLILLYKESSRVEVQRQAEKLKADVEQITRHDIKSPLVGTLNGITYLEQFTETTEEQRDILSDIRESVNTGLELINRSLDIYKMETGVYEYEPEAVDVMAISRRVVADLSGLAASKGITVQIKLDGAEIANGESVHISAEESLLYSVLANLIKNAIEASPNDQQVTIAMTGEADVAIAIHNMGLIPEAIRDTFFDKFATSGKVGGTGLGTYSARLMIQTMGGTIAMNSSEETGTTITVHMPVLAAS